MPAARPRPARVDWDALWAAVAAELAAHRVAGLERLLTEDVVRFATVRALVDQGVQPELLRVEWPAPGLAGGKVDLAVGEPVAAAVELKYPREPDTATAPWTQMLGSVLRDVLRLAALPEPVTDRHLVLVASARLRGFLDRAGDRHGMDLAVRPGRRLELPPERLRALPETASKQVRPWLTDAQAGVGGPDATWGATHDLGDGLQLAVVRVLRWATSPGPAGR